MSDGTEKKSAECPYINVSGKADLRPKNVYKANPACHVDDPAAIVVIFESVSEVKEST